MHHGDVIRELQKVEHALRSAVEHHTKDSEAKATRYSPLVITLIDAQASLARVQAHVDEQLAAEMAP